MGVLIKTKYLNYFLFEVHTQQTYQIKAHSFLILKTSFISSIHKDVTAPDKVLNEKSNFYLKYCINDFGIKTGIEFIQFIQLICYFIQFIQLICYSDSDISYESKAQWLHFLTVCIVFLCFIVCIVFLCFIRLL